MKTWSELSEKERAAVIAWLREAARLDVPGVPPHALIAAAKELEEPAWE